MIYTVSIRTDVPAFYSEWFMNALKRKEVAVRNPYETNTVSLYDLSPDKVDCFWFVSKNYKPMMPYVKSIIKDYNTMWDYTITPYNADIEPNVINVDQSINVFKELSDIVSPGRINLRYDPIFNTKDNKYNLDFHKEKFEHMINALQGYTHTIYFSFVNPYQKVQNNFTDLQEFTQKEREEIIDYMVVTAEKYDMGLRCCPTQIQYLNLINADKIDTSGCMTIEIINQANNTDLKTSNAKNAKMGGCNCVISKDIGAYNTCYHNCLYCYANAYPGCATYKRYDPNSIILCDTIKTTDIIRHSAQKTFKT